MGLSAGDPADAKSPRLAGNAAALAQQLLREATKDAESVQKSYARSALSRKIPAYAIKGVAIFGGLVIAAFPSIDVHILGLVITGAVLTDQWLSNYKRMIVFAVAEKAVARTLRRIRREYNHQIIPVVQINTQPDGSPKAEIMLIDLARKCSEILLEEMDRIRLAVDQADIEFLRALNVDQSTQTHLSSPAAPGGAAAIGADSHK